MDCRRYGAADLEHCPAQLSTRRCNQWLLFDEEAFPDGYGEEMDYGFRARKAGFELAVAEHAYVYHAKGRSYGPDQQKALKSSSREAHLRMHDHQDIRAAIDQTHHNPTLKAMRKAVAAKLKKDNAPLAKL